MTTVRFDLILDDVHAATMCDASGYGMIRDAAIGIRGDRIAWIGPARDLPRSSASFSPGVTAADCCSGSPSSTLTWRRRVSCASPAWRGTLERPKHRDVACL